LLILWNTEEDILKNVGNQTVFTPIVRHFVKYRLLCSKSFGMT